MVKVSFIQQSFVVAALLLHFAHFEKISCGYQQCDSSYQICKLGRCEECSDYISDIQNDCNFITMNRGCLNYCIDNLQKLLKIEHNKNKEIERKETSLLEKIRRLEEHLSNPRNVTAEYQENSTVSTDPELHKLRTYNNIYKTAVIVLSIISVLMALALFFSCKKRRRRRKSPSLDLNEILSNSKPSIDSGISEQQEETVLRSKDRLQQVIPDNENDDKNHKVVVSGKAKSTSDLTNKGLEHESLLKQHA